MRSSLSCGHSGAPGSSTTKGRCTPGAGGSAKPIVRSAGCAVRCRYNTRDAATPASTATCKGNNKVASKVPVATAASRRSSRTSSRQAARSTSDTATSSSRPLMAASGIHASSGAANATNATSIKAAKTPASGVRAPACRCGTDRFKDPQLAKHEKNAPTVLARPWPRHSRLTSSACPLRCASALEMATVWPSATMVKASAMVASRGTSAHCSAGTFQTGKACGSKPTRCSSTPPKRCAATAASVPPTSASISAGARGHRRRTVKASANVSAPTASAGTSGRGHTPSSTSACQPISTAAPLVKPSSTEGATKCVSTPSRSSATATWISPISSVITSASRRYSALPAAASGASDAASASDSALVGPVSTCRLDPASAAIRVGTTALYRPQAAGKPASVAKAMPCGSTSTAASKAACASARSVAALTSRTHGPSPRDRAGIKACKVMHGRVAPP